MVRWNKEYETYEQVYEDGYVRVFRDSAEAKEYAKKIGQMEIPDYPESEEEDDSM